MKERYAQTVGKNYKCHRGTAVKSAKIRQSRRKLASGQRLDIAKTVFIIIYFNDNVNKKICKYVEKNNLF